MARNFHEIKLETGKLMMLEPRGRAEIECFVQVSIAVSLKRIADALTGNDPGVLDVVQDVGAEFRKGWERG